MRSVTIRRGTTALAATAIHVGHDLRPEVEALVALDDATRRREEDPFTDRLTVVAENRVVVHRRHYGDALSNARLASV